MWSDDYEGNGNAGVTARYEGGWEGTSAAYAGQAGYVGDRVWWDGAEWDVIAEAADGSTVTLAPCGGGMSAVVATDTIYG